MVWRDTGVGMDSGTLLNKSLTLGRSGKREEQQAVGGFGVTKAVILSVADPKAGDTWELRTRDLALHSTELGQGFTRFRTAKPLEGTQIRWTGQEAMPRRADYTMGLRRSNGSQAQVQAGLDALSCIAFSDWPRDIEVTFTNHTRMGPEHLVRFPPLG